MSKENQNRNYSNVDESIIDFTLHLFHTINLFKKLIKNPQTAFFNIETIATNQKQRKHTKSQ